MTDSFVEVLRYLLTAQDSLVQIIDQDKEELTKYFDTIEPAIIFALLDRMSGQIREKLLEVLQYNLVREFLERKEKWTRAEIFSGIEESYRGNILASYEEQDAADDLRRDMHLFQKLRDQFPVFSRVLRRGRPDEDTTDESDSENTLVGDDHV